MGTDKVTVRMVVAGLMLLALVVAVGMLLLVAVGDLDPESKRYAMNTAGAMGLSAGGAGAALLASTRSSSSSESATVVTDSSSGEPPKIDDVLPTGWTLPAPSAPTASAPTAYGATTPPGTSSVATPESWEPGIDHTAG